MSDEKEKTSPEGPFAKAVELLLKKELRGFETRIAKHLEGSEARILASVVNSLSPRLTNVELVQKASEHRIRELERRLNNVEDILRCSRADTEPPASG